MKRHAKPAGLTPSAGESPTNSLFQWHANYSDFFGFPTPSAMMRLYGHKVSEQFVNLWEVPNLWLQKFPCESFRATAKVQISAKDAADGVSSGLVIMGWDYARFGLLKKGDSFELQLIDCTDAEQGGAEHVRFTTTIEPSRIYAAGLLPNMECDIWLRAEVHPGGICRFYYSTDGKKFKDTGVSFTARAGKWIGAKIGFYSITPAGVHDRGWMDIIDFDLDKI